MEKSIFSKLAAIYLVCFMASYRQFIKLLCYFPVKVICWLLYLILAISIYIVGPAFHEDVNISNFLTCNLPSNNTWPAIFQTGFTLFSFSPSAAHYAFGHWPLVSAPARKPLPLKTRYFFPVSFTKNWPSIIILDRNVLWLTPIYILLFFISKHFYLSLRWNLFR